MPKTDVTSSMDSGFRRNDGKKILRRLSNTLPTACGVFLLLSTIVLPITILPLGGNFLQDSKTAVFLVVTMVVAALWTLNAFSKKNLQFTFSPFLLPAVLLLVSTIISSFANATYPSNQLLGLGGVYLAASLLLILAPSLIPEKLGKYAAVVIVLPAIILALASGAEWQHVGPSVALNQLWHLGLPNSPLFSLSGSPLVASELMVIALVGSVTYLFTGKNVLKPFFFLTGLVMIGGLVLNVHELAQQKLLTTALPPFGTSWSVAADSLKSLKSSLIGAGPNNYTSVYLQYKPGWVNATPVWNMQFTQASNTPLTLLVTQGALGVLAWVWLMAVVLRRSKRAGKPVRPVAFMSVMVLLLQLLLPPNNVLIFVQVLLLTFWVVLEKNDLKDVQVHAFTVQLIKSGTTVEKVPKHSQFLVYIVTGVSTLLIGLAVFWVGRYSLSQYSFFNAMLATVQNAAVPLYAAQQQAIAVYPYSDEYHRAFASTNLALAQTLAQNKNMTDNDRQQAVSLIQQAVQEGRTTVTIDPNNALNWMTLARIYNNLVGVQEDGDKLALAAYNQALALAPTDPSTNLELGALYYRLGQYPQAVQQLEKTVSLKPDWANAYYNLANAYRQTKQWQPSYDAYQQALGLISNADDTEKVKAEQAEVKKMIDAEAAARPTPTPRPTAAPQTVPTAPPSAIPSSTPAASPSPTPKPSPTEEPNPSVQPTP